MFAYFHGAIKIKMNSDFVIDNCSYNYW